MSLGESIKYLLIAVIGTLYFGLLVRLYLDKNFKLFSICFALIGLTSMVILYLFTPIIFLLLPFSRKFDELRIKKKTYFRIIINHPLDLTMYMFKQVPELYSWILVKAKDAELCTTIQSQSEPGTLFSTKRIHREWGNEPWNEFKMKYGSYLHTHGVG